MAMKMVGWTKTISIFPQSDTKFQASNVGKKMRKVCSFDWEISKRQKFVRRGKTIRIPGSFVGATQFSFAVLDFSNSLITETKRAFSIENKLKQEKNS